MARRIALLAAPEPNSNNQYVRLFFGGNGNGSSLVEVQALSDAHEAPKIVRVHPMIELNRVAVVSDYEYGISDNGGPVSWTQQSVAGAVRQAQWVPSSSPGGYVLMITYRRGVFRNSTALNMPESFGGTHLIYDSFWASDMKGWILSGDSDVGVQSATLYYTEDGGANWVSYGLNSLTSGLDAWEPTEAPRRIKVDEIDRVIILSSQKVWALTHNTTMTSVTGTLLWDFESAVSAYVANTGYQSNGTDLNNRFDSLAISGAGPNVEVWISGHQNLMARFKPSVFPFSIINTYGNAGTEEAVAAQGLNDWYTGVIIPDPWQRWVFPTKGFATGPTVGGIAVHYSNSEPVSMYGWKYISGRWIIDMDVVTKVYDGGCSNPNSCNHSEGVYADNGTCFNAVALKGCVSGMVINAVSDELYQFFRPLNPTVAIPIDGPLGDDQSIAITFSAGLGVNTIIHNSSIPSSFDSFTQKVLFLQELVATINSSGTGFVAWRNNEGGITIEAPFINYSGTVVSVSGLAGPPFVGEFSAPRPGKIVKLEGYDECFTVIGLASCDQEAISSPNIIEVYDACSDCGFSSPGCMCDSVLSWGSKEIRPNTIENPVCVGIFGDLKFDLNIEFPEVEHPYFSVQSFTNYPANTFKLTGDHTWRFFVGSQFSAYLELPDASGSGSGSEELSEFRFTVLNASFDGTTTTIIASGSDELNEYEYIRPNGPCVCRVDIIQDHMNPAGVFETVSSKSIPCVENAVTGVHTVPLAWPTNVQANVMRVRMIARGCETIGSCEWYLAPCYPIRVNKEGCHKYSVSINESYSPPFAGAKFTNLKITSMSSMKVLHDSPVTNAKINGVHDDVYLVQFTSGSSKFYGVIVDICDLLKCQRSLLDKSICLDPCDDCSDKDHYRTLASINLVIDLIRLMSEKVGSWSGIGEPNDSQRSYLIEFASTVAASRAISRRCGDCSGIKTEDEKCKEC